METTERLHKIEAKKRGNTLGLWFFRISLRLFGLRGTYGLLYIVCFYYVLCDWAAVSAALAYIDRRFPGCSFIKKRVHVYRLFISQGKQLIDRCAAISGQKKFDIQLRGYNELIPLIRDSEQGFILLLAHVGNWQIAMTALKKLNKIVYLVMRPEDNPAVAQSLHISDEQAHIRIISPEQHLGGVVQIMNVLKDGNIVCIMGDRSYGFNTLDVSFLGDTAWFPYGAFSIAASAECPIVVLLSAKQSVYRYVVDVTHVLYPRYKGRSNKHHQLRQWVQEFAALLDKYVDSYPYQCFLFHDVWRKKSNEIQQD